MQALVYTEPLTVAVLEVPEPVPGPGEVVVEVRAAGICGSELEGFANQSPFRVPPLIMGHEFAGVRHDTGEHVVVNPLVSCLECDLCRRSLVNVCRKRQIIGIHRPGGFADRVAVPSSNCVSVDPSVPFTSLALAEPLANAVHALRLAQRHDAWPQRVGVIGCGMLGMAVGLVAARRGIPDVAICDLSPARLAGAARSGLVAAGPQLSGEYDLIIDTVGSPETRGSSVALIRPGGTAVWLGLHGEDSEVDELAMIRNEKQIVTSFCYDRNDFEIAVRLASELKPDWIDTRTLPGGAEIFTAMSQRTVDAIKVLLVAG